MNKNIMLHGATNCNSSNYGDFIYGDMIYDYLKTLNYNVNFYQPSNFFKKYLLNYDKNINFKKRQSNMIIYIPGGYFGEGANAKLKDNIIQFLRFMPLGIWAAFHKRKMVVLGVGAGPISNIFIKFGVKKICNNSQLITVRDNNSYQCLKKISKNSSIYESSDLILTYKLKYPKNITKQIEKIKENANNKKIFIIHFNHDKVALKRFAEAVNLFNKKCSDEYYYVVTSDSILKDEEELISQFAKLVDFEFYHFKYDNPHELSALIKESNTILTCKLHLGVIGSMLNKNVFAIACHYEKTRRFYNQIKYSDRCLDLYSTSSKQICDLILKNQNNSIVIPKSEINKSNVTWKLFKEIIEEKENE